MHKNYQNPKDKPRTQNGHNWWTCGRANHRKYWANYQIRRRRQAERRLIIHEEWDKLGVLDEPRDKWLWD